MELSHTLIKGSDLLNPSLSSSNTNTKNIFVRDSKPSSISKNLPKKAKNRKKNKRTQQCPFCSRKLKHKKGLKQHIAVKHPEKVQRYQRHKKRAVFKPDLDLKSIVNNFPLKKDDSVILADENLNFDSYLVKKLAQVQKKHVCPLPDHMRGYCDEMILRFLIARGYGLVTQDKVFAIRASKQIENVYLLSQNSLIKMEKVIF
ncbi:hypothetical protein [Candidatus Lokiarchaeum ossiferum]|uniref:hypothetical protein n=1 Tax=Candidatus Lokiarchaeum ossiferum TaxID=2951803 RepID=UPI00352ED098